MKLYKYIVFVILIATMFGCKEEDHPYVGYIVVQRAVIEASGGSTTLTADTDISDPIRVIGIDDEGSEWCSVSVNGKELTITASQANPSKDNFRTATVTLRCGYRVTEFTVLQKYEGQQYLEYDWTLWNATGSDVQASDGGGYPSLFNNDRTNFWHSQYSPALTEPLPHQIVIDMQKEQPVAMVQIGRRYYAENGNNYPSVKTMEVYAGTDNENYTKVGGFSFSLPWTAPDGTIVNGNSPLVPPYEEVILDEITTARYFKLVITETNNTNGTCQVSYFKAYEPL
ncbi:discoidin domain-containing protein [Proteiniphilum sp. UBA5384]|uniref:discoidin domain-containing protein n=1 Tax=Proteiniphilum sp. UBA5384 TaxID=1947279 RepID=UPI0025D7AF0D|nr:discoidin domain-containing protein [Proteiniphilum sp. UBA5384]